MRVSDAVRCARRHRVAGPWSASAPIIREGRLHRGVPRGAVRRFAETDYCYGVGPLTLLVRHVQWDKPVPIDGDLWLEVEGVVIDPAGRTGAHRQVLVRAGQLPAPPPPKRPRLRP
ncbi:hypothetical protein [Mangrovihabitans endophyticus]|uniref:Uncharacterized protein n=1 Tax=Mangrovihabitans endophyticus TaxID=1751298 RepID=A0A8J3FRD4_9ACTN|nr:hypothetical protein [Mangrovihabitans endophyticus]GGL05685.1 hypothetical protein GCM10012284_45100 [Mangrovihabitans endophyticus]